jgi:dTDP-4-dehydrorhamnose 3,5-epimerase
MDMRGTVCRKQAPSVDATGLFYGFLVASESTDFLDKVMKCWYPRREHSVLWRDSIVSVWWPVGRTPRLANKDATGKLFAEADYFA